MADKDTNGLIIEIESTAEKASSGFNKTVKFLNKVKEATESIDVQKLESFSKCLKDLSTAGNQMSNASKGLRGITTSIKSLSNVDSSKLKEITDAVEKIGSALGNLGSNNKISIRIDSEGIKKTIKSAEQVKDTFRSLNAPKIDASQLQNGAKILGQKKKGSVIKNGKFEKFEFQKFDSSSIKDITAEAEKAEETLDDLVNKSKELNETGNLKDAADGYEKIADSAEKVNQETNNTSGSAENLANAEQHVGTAAQTANGRIKLLIDQINNFKKTISGMESGKVSFDATKYEDAVRGIQTATKQFNDYKKSITLPTDDGNGSSDSDAGTTRQLNRISEAFKKIASNAGNAAKKANSALHAIGTGAKNLVQSLNGFIQNTVKKFTGALKTSAKARNDSFKGLKKKLGSVARLGVFMMLRSAFTQFFELAKTGFSNLVIYSNRMGTEFHKNVNLLYNDLKFVGNSFATAAEPILNFLTPVLDYLMEKLAAAATMLSQFFAALTGKATYTKAIKQTQDYAQALDDASKSAKKQLATYDELNNLTSNSSSSDALNGDASNMFTTEEVTNPYKEAADQLKEIMASLFAPLKQSWDESGQYVMDSWSNAVTNIKGLLKDIGTDFLEVWNQPASISVLNDMWTIVGDIGQVVGNLAGNLDAAWQENDTGKRIFENIRDILGDIVGNIKNAADKTVEWSKDIDFSPILQKMEEWTSSLSPVVENLSGVVSDFYTSVILPLSKWVMEKGLPDLLQVLIDFNAKVDWETLRANLKELWEHIEPFAETVGEGLVIFIGRVSDALADFINSDEFKDFLNSVEEWMDDVTPQDVADGIQAIATAIIALKGAMAVFSAVKGISTVISTITTLAGLFSGGTGAATAAGGAGTATAAAGAGGVVSAGLWGIAGALAAVVGYLGGNKLAEMYGEWIGDEGLVDAAQMPFLEKVQTLKDAFADGTWSDALKLWGDDIAESFDYVGETIGGWCDDLLDNATETWESVKTTTSEKWASIKESLSAKTGEIRDDVAEAWGNVTEKTSSTWESVRTSVSEKWENIKQEVSTRTEGIVESISTAWENTKTKTSETWDNVKASTSEKWGGLKETLSTKVGGIQTSISEKWSSVKSDTSTAWQNVKTLTSEKWQGIKQSISTATTSIRGTVSDKWGSIKSNLSNTMGSVKTNMTTAWSTIKTNVTSKSESIKTSVSSKWDSIKSNTSSKWDSIKTTISTKMESAKTSVKNAIDKMKSFFNFTWSLPKIKLPHFSISGSFSLKPPSVPSFSVSWYKAGGYLPNSYSLFGAGENGVPEILGTVGGKNAVAGGEEITGIRDAVYSTSQQEVELMREQNQLLQAILQKEFGISSTDIGKAARKYAKEYYQRTGNNAYAY